MPAPSSPRADVLAPTPTTNPPRVEEYISLLDATKLVPNRPHYSTLYRWAKKGVKARNGERIRLQYRRFGGQIWTRAAWIDEFAARLTAADSEHETQTKSEPRSRPRRSTPAACDERRAAARRALEAEGII